MNDLISRQMVIDKINERQRKLIYCFGFDNDMVKIIDIVKSIVIAIPPAQPEQQEISYKDCADATLKMWIDNVLTDGEYNRIMNKLNAYWRERKING